MNTKNWKSTAIRFLSAQTVSLFGSSLVQYAIIWYITLSTSSGKLLTIATLCGFIPQILISLFAGVWVDRYDRKKVIMFADSIIALSTLALALLFMNGYRNINFLFLVLIIRSAGTGIQTPAVSAIIPQIVPKEHLMKINSIYSTLSSLMMFLSPAISGAILSAASLEITLLIDVVTAMVGVGITATIFIDAYEKKKASSNTAFTDIKAGFSYLKQNRFLKNLLLFQIIILFLISPSAFLTPLMVSRRFGAEIWRLTASEMTYSLGMILGGILLTSFGGFKKKLKTTLSAGAAYGFLMLGLGLSPIFWVYLLCNSFIGITSPYYSTPITATIQETVSSDMQGRIFSFMQIASSCALPLGMLLFGPLSDIISVQTILLSCGCLVIVSTAIAYRKINLI